MKIGVHIVSVFIHCDCAYFMAIYCGCKSLLQTLRRVVVMIVILFDEEEIPVLKI